MKDRITIKLDAKLENGALVIRIPIRVEAFRDPTDMKGFTPREMSILRLIVQHKLTKEIADELNISERTIKFHVSAMLRKTGHHTRESMARAYSIIFSGETHEQV